MTKLSKKPPKKELNLQTPEMETEFGSEWTGEAKRVAEKVETRVKTSASRYGFCEENE